MDPVLSANMENLTRKQSSLFSNDKHMPPLKNNKGHWEGFNLQKSAQLIASNAEVIWKKPPC
jgi:hypothetical protein